jgi:hypothetical protein
VIVDWLNQNAGAVQALAAIGTPVLTVVLAAATVWYAKSAKEQIEELRKARTAAVEPYVRIPSMRLEIFWNRSLVGTSDRTERNLLFEAPLANLGPGPALDIRPWLELPMGIQVDYEGPSNLGSGEESKAVIRVSPAHFEALVTRFPYATAMRVWYRDLLDRQWLTSSEVVLGWIGPANDGEVAAIMTPTAERRELVDRHEL